MLRTPFKRRDEARAINKQKIELLVMSGIDSSRVTMFTETDLFIK